MGGETGGASGAGTGAPAGTGGTPAPPVGGGAPGAGGGGQQAPQPRVVPEDILPEELRGRSPQEQKFILSNLAGSMRALAADKQRLEQELASSRKGGSGKRGRPREEDDEGEEKPKKPIEERILDDPAGTIREVVEELYGPVVSSLSEGVSEGVVHTIRSEYPDFREYEQDVLGLLKEANAPKTRQNIEIAYQTVIGRKELEKRRQAHAEALNPDVPKEGEGEKAKLPELVGLEREIWLGSGMSREQWDQYKKGEFEIKVPMGKKAPAATT